MSLNKAEHIIKEFEGTRVRILESKCTKERVDFLQKLMELNQIEVMVQENEPDEEGKITFDIGTPDVTFNIIVKVYNRELMTFEGHRVTPDYYNQMTEETEPNYWDRSKKEWINKK